MHDVCRLCVFLWNPYYRLKVVQASICFLGQVDGYFGNCDILALLVDFQMGRGKYE